MDEMIVISYDPHLNLRKSFMIFSIITGVISSMPISFFIYAALFKHVPNRNDEEFGDGNWEQEIYIFISCFAFLPPLVASVSYFRAKNLQGWPIKVNFIVMLIVSVLSILAAYHAIFGFGENPKFKEHMPDRSSNLLTLYIMLINAIIQITCFTGFLILASSEKIHLDKLEKMKDNSDIEMAFDF